MSKTSYIASIGVAIPSLQLPLDELARHLQVDPQKYAKGLGARAQALCDDGESPVTLGVRAAKDALRRWGKDIDQIGMIAVGTESALDMSRPLSAWIADELKLPANVRSYEVKHACQAGTIALRQAVEWQLSGAARGKAALVICADEALYRPGHPGEPTQGACAVAMVVDPNGGIAKVSPYSWSWQRPAFDFYRPVGEPFPEVDGPFSVRCYQDAFCACLQQWSEDTNREFPLRDVQMWAMHAPFPKMVWKGFSAGMQSRNLSPEDTQTLFDQTVSPALEWNTQVGNCYTASAWLAFTRALTHPSAPERIALFSYGSGCGAELVLLRALPEPARQLREEIARDVEGQLTRRRTLRAEDYAERRSGAHNTTT